MSAEAATQADLLVVGGGLTGLSAAAEAARLGLRCSVLSGPQPGGLLLSIDAVQGLPEHPQGIAGYELCPMTQEEAEEAGAVFLGESAWRLERAGESWQVDTAAGSLRAPCVLLASGGRLRSLGVPGEARLLGKGVSHCASCDGPLLRGKTVAVAGGGDAACQEALELARHAGQVHLLVRGDALRARPAWRERLAAAPNIALQLQRRVCAVEGEPALSGVRLDDGSLLACQALFVYVGLEPASEWLRGQVALDAGGHVRTDAELRCLAPAEAAGQGPLAAPALPGLWAAGIVRAEHSGQAADAAADGRRAARAAHDFLGARTAVASAGA